METFGKIYHFGQKIGATLSFDGERYCRLKLLNGRELRFYGDGRIVVDDYEWTPPEIMLESIKADLKYARKCGFDSDPKGFLEHFRTTQTLIGEYVQEIEEILAEPQRKELEDVLCTIENNFQYLSKDERASIQPHYEALHKHCYGGGPIDKELVQRELRAIWDKIGSIVKYIIDRRYTEEIENLRDFEQLAGLEEEQL